VNFYTGWEFTKLLANFFIIVVTDVAPYRERNHSVLGALFEGKDPLFDLDRKMMSE
jgi:hypothetical protein